jgi:hypothetical protein
MIFMYVTIQITFLCRGQRVYRSGSFPLRGRTPEKVVKDWINEIQREMEIEEFLKIVIDGEVVDV